MPRYEIGIVGAGIAGIATAYYLAVKYGRRRIALIDSCQPMSLTTSVSGENYRDYWPQACMASFAGHSLDLIEELVEQNPAAKAFELRPFGYEFVSEVADREIFPSQHLRGSRDGVSRCSDDGWLREQRPYLSETVQQVVHIERAGAFDVHALGSFLLAGARAAGVELIRATVENIDQGTAGLTLSLATASESEQLVVEKLVLAAGPFVEELASMLEISLPIESFLQRKIVIPDPDRLIPREMPFTVFADPQRLRWSSEEQDLIAADDELVWLLEEFPAGLHIKPESRAQIKLGWAFNQSPEKPRWSPADELNFPDVVLRGASRFIPDLARYSGGRIPTPVVQYSGYYTRTPENWPLIGPLQHDAVYLVAALSGFGTMCACAAGELCADWILGDELPEYSRHFHPDRSADPAIVAEIEALESDGQL